MHLSGGHQQDTVSRHVDYLGDGQARPDSSKPVYVVVCCMGALSGCLPAPLQQAERCYGGWALVGGAN